MVLFSDTSFDDDVINQVEKHQKLDSTRLRQGEQFTEAMTRRKTMHI